MRARVPDHAIAACFHRTGAMLTDDAVRSLVGYESLRLGSGDVPVLRGDVYNSGL